MDESKAFVTGAKWIGAGKGIPAPIFRREFYLENKPDRAEIRICACGFFELFVNGKRIGEDYYKPVWSNYGKVVCPILDLDVSDFRVYSLTYDLTECLTAGENVLAVMLGKGWYMQDDDVMQKMTAYGDTLKFIADLQIENGGETTRVFTDERFLCDDGFITFTNIYYGERQDLALFDEAWTQVRFDCGNWRKARAESAPDAEITAQDCPSDRIAETLLPRLVREDENGKIYDAGVNVSGFVELVSGGGDLSVTFAENLKEDGSDLDFDSILAFDDKTLHADEFKNTRKGQRVHPFFVWHGFRYFRVCGETEQIFCKVVHTSAPVISHFESDDAVLNWYFNAFVRTQLNNMHCGVPSDCPHRERKGYTGDGQLVADAAMLTLDCKDFYRKWIRDILDTQDRHTGFVPYTAPYYGGGGGIGGWGSAIVIVPYRYYQHYGEEEMLRKCFPAMLRWIACMESHTEKGLLVGTQYRVYNLGDWCTPEKTVLPEIFVNTYFYVKCLDLVKKIGEILGVSCGFDADERMEKLKKALVQNFYDPEKDCFCDSVQGADLFAADLGLASDALLERTAKRYDENPVFDTGIFGTELLVKILFEKGFPDTAYKLLSSRKYPSFGYMAERGATTLWETWDGKDTLIGVNSHDHPMFGAAAKYLFYGILGIRRETPAFRSVTVAPVEIEGLRFYRGVLQTINGKIEVEYRKGADKTEITVYADPGIEISLRFRACDKAIESGKKTTVVFFDRR